MSKVIVVNNLDAVEEFVGEKVSYKINVDGSLLVKNWENDKAIGEKVYLAGIWKTVTHLSTKPPKKVLTTNQMYYMATRFLGWELPKDFSPDAGISFTPDFNTDTPYPAKHKPVGTNLFNVQQAFDMVKYMAQDLPA